MLEKAKKWASSLEGKETAKKAFENAQKMKDRLDDARKFDPSKLNEPITL